MLASYIQGNCLPVFATLRMGQAMRWAMTHRRQVLVQKKQCSIKVHCWRQKHVNPCIFCCHADLARSKTGARAQKRREADESACINAVQQRVAHVKFLKNRSLSAAYASTQGRVRGSLPSARSDWKKALPSRMFL